MPQACNLLALLQTLQAEAGWRSELEQYQLDLQVRLSLQNGQVEAADSLPLTDHSDMVLLDRSHSSSCLHVLLI